MDDNGVLTLIYTGHVWLGEPATTAGAGSAMSGHQRSGIRFVKHGRCWPRRTAFSISAIRKSGARTANGGWWSAPKKTVSAGAPVPFCRSAPGASIGCWPAHWRRIRVYVGMPGFLPAGEQHLLLFSPAGLAAQGCRYRNRFQSGYLLGHWRPDSDFRVTQPFCELDAGHDFYAPQTFTAADGRRLLFLDGYVGITDAQQSAVGPAPSPYRVS
ncbi:hypothetical protein M8494_13510 [Serratia ureilytica]